MARFSDDVNGVVLTLMKSKDETWTLIVELFTFYDYRLMGIVLRYSLHVRLLTLPVHWFCHIDISESEMANPVQCNLNVLRSTFRVPRSNIIGCIFEVLPKFAKGVFFLLIKACFVGYK